MLEAYEQQCNEAAKIFAEYKKRLHYYVNQAREVQRSTANSAYDSPDNINTKSGKESVYSTVKGNESSDDVIVIETTRERHIRKACETLTAHTINKIRTIFPSYDGIGVHLDPYSDADKLFELDCEVPDDVKAVAIDALKNPSLLLQNVSTYNSRVTAMIHNETEKIDIKADAELLRCFLSSLVFDNFASLFFFILFFNDIQLSTVGLCRLFAHFDSMIFSK